MKKAVLFCLAFVPTSLFGFQVPLDRDGVAFETLDDMGVKVFTTSMSNVASSPFMAAIPTASVTGSSIALYGVLTSTLPTGRVAGDVFVQIRSSDTLNETSELLIPEIPVSSTTENTFIVFNPPIVVPIRMVVSIRSVSIDITSDTVPVSYFYNYLTTSAPRNPNWIPLDEYSGRKVHNKSFYGVQVATQVVPGNGVNNGIGTDALDNTADERILTSTSVLTKTMLYGWIAGTGTVTNYVVFEDTEGVSATTPAIPTIVPIFYNAEPFNPNAVEWKTKAYSFPWPIVFERGLTVRRNATTDQFRVLKRGAETVR